MSVSVLRPHFSGPRQSVLCLLVTSDLQSIKLYLQFCNQILYFHVGEQEIKSLKVICRNSDNGCDWEGELQSLDDHLTTCEYTLLRCPNRCVRKKKSLLRCDLDQHLKECTNRQYQCPHCRATGRYRNITTTHLGICPKVKIPCPNGNCKISVLRCNLSNH